MRSTHFVHWLAQDMPSEVERDTIIIESQITVLLTYLLCADITDVRAALGTVGGLMTFGLQVAAIALLSILEMFHEFWITI